MRRPVAADRVHVTDPTAAPVLDAANAVYSLMLRCLTAVYDTPTGPSHRRAALLASATGLMKLLAAISDELTQLLANDVDGVKAGVTFTMLRSTEGLAPGVDVRSVLRERFAHIRAQLPNLALSEAKVASLVGQLEGATLQVTGS
jgi:hypothetical protein